MSSKASVIIVVDMVLDVGPNVVWDVNSGRVFEAFDVSVVVVANVVVLITGIDMTY